MNRLVVRSLALALLAASGSVLANGFQDMPYPAYDDGYGREAGYEAIGYDLARVLSVDPIIERGQPSTREECWPEPAPRHADAGGYDSRYATGYDARYDGRYDPRYDGRHDPRYGSRYPARTGSRYDARYDGGYRRENHGGAVLGAIVGGALGHQVGKGDGRKAATIVGAVLGAAIGNNVQRQGEAYRHDPYRRTGYRGDGYGPGYADPYGDAGYRGQYVSQVQRCRLVSDGPADDRVSGYRVSYEYAGRQYQTITDYHPGSELRVRVEVTPEG